ncbi:MAG: type IV pilus biogenesis protein PilM [Minisyncoccia bacterium]
MNHQQTNQKFKFALNNSKIFFQRKWVKFLMPDFPIYGVSIDEKSVKVILFDKNSFKIKKIFSYPLKPKVIEEGILKKPDELKFLIHSLRKKFWLKEKQVFLILSLPSSNFYLQIFSLPEMEEKMLEEAIIFNVQTNSPLPLEEAYFDWEKLKEKENGEIEIFTALGIKKNIDAYLDIFQREGFEVIALEPYVLSVARALNQLNEEFNKKNFLVIDFKLEGIEFMLFEKGHLIYFDYDSWNEVFPLGIPQNIELSHIKDHFKKEIPALLNYFPLKRNQKIDCFSLLCFNKAFGEPLRNFVIQEYQLPEFKFNISSYYPKPIDESFLGVIGAGLRGLIPRSYDTIVSLMPIGTEEKYLFEYTKRISSLWSKIFLVFLLFFSFSLFLVDKVYIYQVRKNLEKSLNLLKNSPVLAKEKDLSKKAEDFNRLVGDINNVLSYRLKIEEILKILLEKSDNFKITIRKIMISGYPSKNFTFQGKIDSKEKAFDFLSALKDSGQFENVSLPFSNISETQEGVVFYLTGNFK